MNKMIKIVLLALAIVGVIMIALYFFMLKAFDNNRDEIISEQTVIFEEINDSIYIRARAWGVSGNHNEIIISLDPIEREGRQAEKEKDYIFYATEIYYKKQGIDTLLIYADGSSIGKKPAVFTERIKIVPVKIKTADEAMKYEKNYKKYGLTKVSAYP